MDMNKITSSIQNSIMDALLPSLKYATAKRKRNGHIVSLMINDKEVLEKIIINDIIDNNTQYFTYVDDKIESKIYVKSGFLTTEPDRIYIGKLENLPDIA